MKNSISRISFFRKRLQRIVKRNPLLLIGLGVGSIVLLLGITTMSSKTTTQPEEITKIVTSTKQQPQEQKISQQIATDTTKSNVLCKLVDTSVLAQAANKEVKQKSGSTSTATNMSTCSIAFKKPAEGIRSVSLMERTFESPEQASQYAQTIQNEGYQAITLQSETMMYSTDSQQGHIVRGTSYLAITINGKLTSIEQVAAIAKSIRLQ